jgi:hypothetical protein
MGELGNILFPVGGVLILMGIVLVTNSPFMKEILDQAEYLQKHRSLVGGVLVILGLLVIVLTIGA